MTSMVKITLKKGMIGRTETQKKIVKALGLRKFGSSCVHYTSPTINGMLDKVAHLVEVCEAKEGDKEVKKETKKENKKETKPAAKASK